MNFKFLIFEGNVAIGSFLLNPGNNFFHLLMSNFGEVIVIPGPHAFNGAIGSFLSCNLFKTFIGNIIIFG